VVHNAGREDSTLRHIRGFRDDELGHPLVEDRLQQCLVTQLKRPIALFWSLQDMVGGLIDAIKGLSDSRVQERRHSLRDFVGHQFLVEYLGILHRDVSETNIVLCVDRTERARGYLMDFDMATKLAPPSDPPAIETSQSGSTTAVATSVRGSHSNSGGSGHPEDQAPKAARTGTTPYMATDVLRGHPHTPAHDLESFFYVLYLFLHTYDGPLPAHAHWPRPELFVSGRTRRLPHVRTWPPSLRAWATGALDAAANDKAGRMADADHVFSSLRTELPRYWRARADAHALIRVAYDVFWRAVEGTRTRVLRVGLNHQEFIDALEGWLREYPESAEDMIKATS
jgi:serine/threonine protein kinase